MITQLERQKLKDEIMEELLEEVIEHVEIALGIKALLPEEEAQEIIYGQH
jgi:hypothetical protein